MGWSAGHQFPFIFLEGNDSISRSHKINETIQFSMFKATSQKLKAKNILGIYNHETNTCNSSVKVSFILCLGEL